MCQCIMCLQSLHLSRRPPSFLMHRRHLCGYAEPHQFNRCKHTCKHTHTPHKLGHTGSYMWPPGKHSSTHDYNVWRSDLVFLIQSFVLGAWGYLAPSLFLLSVFRAARAVCNFLPTTFSFLWLQEKEVNSERREFTLGFFFFPKEKDDF